MSEEHKRKAGEASPAERPASRRRHQQKGTPNSAQSSQQEEGAFLEAKGENGGKEDGEKKLVVCKAFKEQKSLMLLMLKCVVQSQQRLRDVEGVVFTVVLLPTEASIVDSAKHTSFGSGLNRLDHRANNAISSAALNTVDTGIL